MDTINFNTVADIYDWYVNTEFDVPFFLEETKTAGSQILELMCGTGRLSIPLLKNGRKLVCVDYSQKMLDRFSEKIKNDRFDIKLVNQNVCNLKLDRTFETIILPFHSFAEITDKNEQQKALEKISKHLLPGGKFICTLQNPVFRTQTADGQIRYIGKFSDNSGKSLVLSIVNRLDKKENIVTGMQFYEIYDNENKLIEKRILDIIFRLIEKNEFEKMVHTAGLSINKIYGDYSYSEFNPNESQFMIYSLTK